MINFRQSFGARGREGMEWPSNQKYSVSFYSEALEGNNSLCNRPGPSRMYTYIIVTSTYVCNK